MIGGLHRKTSTIKASQLPMAYWYDVISEESIEDAILDRIVRLPIWKSNIVNLLIIYLIFVLD